MKIISWNVNGLRAVQQKGFIEWMKTENPDILCLQETKASPEQLNDDIINIKGYHSFFHSAEKKGYSGVAIYSKTKPLSVKNSIGIERFDSEGRILIAKYNNFTLFNIYFPNGQMNDERLAYKMEFYDAVLNYLNALKKKKINLIICGDYNTAHREIDLKNPKANEMRSGFLPMEREWMDKLIANNFIDTYRHLHPHEIKYSWWSYRSKARVNNTGWRIDYFFVSDYFIDKIKDADILTDIKGSDHCPVYITLKKL